MATFQYRGLDAAGRSCQGLMEAADSKEARERLVRIGIFPEEVAPVSSEAWATATRGHMSSEMRAALYHELSAMLEAGLPLGRALHMLVRATDPVADRHAIAAIRAKVEEGMALSQVIKESPLGVQPFEVAALEAGERVGNLAIVLGQLAEFLEAEQKIRAEIHSALIYPTIVVSAAVIVGTVTLAGLMPRLNAMMQEAGIAIPPISRFALSAAKVVFFALLAVVVVGGFVAIVAIRSRKKAGMSYFHRRLEQLVWKIPWAASLMGSLVSWRFARTMALLLHGGVPMVEAVALAARATGSSELSEAGERMAENIKHGASLRDSLQVCPQLAGHLTSWVEAGEGVGQLPHMLEVVSGRLESFWRRRISNLLATLEPILTILVGVIVLLVALAVLAPVMSMTRGL